MISLDVIKAKNILDGSGLDESSKKKLLSIAVGLTAARLASIPTEKVDSYVTHYETISVNEVNEYIYKLNEQILIDIDLAVKTGRNYWCVRYKTVYPDMSINLIIGDGFDIFCKLSGVDNHFSLDEYKLCSDNVVVLSNIINLLSSSIS